MTTLLSSHNHRTKHYQTDQQVKYLHLEAEVDMLLQKLTAQLQRKEVVSSPATATQLVELSD